MMDGGKALELCHHSVAQTDDDSTEDEGEEGEEVRDQLFCRCQLLCHYQLLCVYDGDPKTSGLT